MKKLMTLALAAIMMLGLVGCGSKKEEQANVDLTGFYNSLATEYGWDDNTMANLTDDPELLEMYYPGLSEINTTQLIAKAPMMSSVVNEFVFLQCETEEDAAKAAEILQTRITAQAEGGAWYPESMEAWGRGVVDQQGTYVAMIASAEYQEDITAKWQAQFQ
ncbi:MAG: DUF4358 domain-containing protein [Oscillibacter sp.]|jgi:hypothetical protein|nr:DUF4358 domain-containing protein [Oscillibacter sp.]